jgi:hypothetical protein
VDNFIVGFYLDLSVGLLTLFMYNISFFVIVMLSIYQIVYAHETLLVARTSVCFIIRLSKMSRRMCLA